MHHHVTETGIIIQHIFYPYRFYLKDDADYFPAGSQKVVFTF